MAGTSPAMTMSNHLLLPGHWSYAIALPSSGIDLRRTPGDRWGAFEVNPSPICPTCQMISEKP